MINRVSVIVLGIGLAACAIPEDDQLGEVDQAVKKCTDTDICGSNSPVIKIYGTSGFNLDGDVNDEGFRYRGMSQNGAWFELVVHDSRIVGLDRHRQPVLQDQSLVGAKIWIERGKEQFAIEIKAIGELAEVVPPNNLLQTYVLEWDEVLKRPLPPAPTPIAPGTDMPVPGLANAPVAVCSATPVPPSTNWNWDPGDAEWDESWSMTLETKYNTPYHSLVFEGDHVHAASRTIEQGMQDRWFNIGCARHTLAKMRLTRNTQMLAAWEQTQSVMKMFAADYCGLEAFTIPGHKLVWRDYAGMQNYYGTPLDLEARWNENGAMCLENPRYASRKEIEAVCGPINYCKDPDPLNREKELVTSANYK